MRSNQLSYPARNFEVRNNLFPLFCDAKLWQFSEMSKYFSEKMEKKCCLLGTFAIYTLKNAKYKP